MTAITVGIVTARKNEDTTYAAWRKLGLDFLRGAWRDPVMTGEWAALVASLRCFPPELHHVEHQLHALALQTRVPDEVIVVDRCFGAAAKLPPGRKWPFKVFWAQPLVWPMEAAAGVTTPRARTVCYGCADKNTIIALCQTEHLLVLDDCCVPGFALVEKALKVCESGRILLPQHRQLYLPKDGRAAASADSNTGPGGHDVFGVWAMPLEFILNVNGLDTVNVDGKRGADDRDLKARMDLASVVYAYEPMARMYEVQHTYPWAGPEHDALAFLYPTQSVAPGPSLRAIREAVQNAGTEEARLAAPTAVSA